MLIIPPSFIFLQVDRFRFWFPVFILWPVAASLELILFPLAIATALLIWPWWGTSRASALAFVLPRVTGLFAATRGLRITMHDAKGKYVIIRVI